MRLPVVKFDVLDISVRNPVKVVGDETYTTYEISIQTTDIAFSLSRSVTRRRFSEFAWLRKKLKDHHPQLNPPPLPKKTFFGERFDPEFISVRMKSLEEFLVMCFAERLYFSDSSMHLFVQSRLTCEQIDDYLRGSLSQAQVEAARDKCHVRMAKSWYDESTEELPTDSHTDRHTDTNLTSPPRTIPPSRWEQFSKDISSSSESISDSLESDMYVSCAVGTGSIQ